MPVRSERSSGHRTGKQVLDRRSGVRLRGVALGSRHAQPRVRFGRSPDSIPTPEFQFLSPHFDQFAQSHRFWAPDSRHFVYFGYPTTGSRRERSRCPRRFGSPTRRPPRYGASGDGQSRVLVAEVTASALGVTSGQGQGRRQRGRALRRRCVPNVARKARYGNAATGDTASLYSRDPAVAVSREMVRSQRNGSRIGRSTEARADSAKPPSSSRYDSVGFRSARFRCWPTYRASPVSLGVVRRCSSWVPAYTTLDGHLHALARGRSGSRH